MLPGALAGFQAQQQYCTHLIPALLSTSVFLKSCSLLFCPRRPLPLSPAILESFSEGELSGGQLVGRCLYGNQKPGEESLNSPGVRYRLMWQLSLNQ